MCGIAGVLTSAGSTRATLERGARDMSNAIANRGPDDQGLWSDHDAGLALTQRRLSIVDLSPAGHQPMVSADGRFVITYNGEIYNFGEMRAELEAQGIVFRGHSDTEVMLEAFAAYGVEPTVKRLIGMFAFAVWDRRDRTLTLVRDRLGIKPLYWAQFGAIFLFGSELKALRAWPGFNPGIDRSAIASFMRHNYIPAPQTVYEGVRKLQQGTILTVRAGHKPSIAGFWNPRAIACAGLAEPLHASDRELTDQLETLLQDAVSRRMVADVPVGAFLSGGIDSSTVAALMKASNSGPVRTYTIGFEHNGYDEAKHAAAVARHLGTDHTEMIVSPQDALSVIPKLAEFYDEPFADSSQIPTYLISALTRRHVTVALSGDGGDELFAGYNRYDWAERLNSLRLLPHPLRRALATAITALPADRWTHLSSFIPAAIRPRQAGDKMYKVAALMSSKSDTDLYRQLLTHWDPARIVLSASEAKGILWDSTVDNDFPNLLDRMQFLDLVTYLPDDILTKVDRASMAVALEARVPLIDHRVVEFAWRLPRDAKLRGRTTKWLLRQVLYRHVPRSLVERPKMGFAVPLAAWLRGPLRAWAETLLEEGRLSRAGFFDVAEVRRVWADHLASRRNCEHLLWSVLMFEAWRDRWGSNIS